MRKIVIPTAAIVLIACSAQVSTPEAVDLSAVKTNKRERGHRSDWSCDDNGRERDDNDGRGDKGDKGHDKRTEGVCHYDDKQYKFVSASSAKDRDAHLKKHPKDVPAGEYFPDANGDGFGDPGAKPSLCPKPGYVTNNGAIGKFVQDAAAGYCARLATCCNMSQAEFDSALCEATVIRGGINGSLFGLNNLTDHSNLTFDAAAAAACITKASNHTCNSIPVGEWVSAFRTSCANAVKGKVAAGGSCRESLECVAGNYCDRVGDAGVGTCRATLPVGAPCGQYGVDSWGYAGGLAHESCSTRSLGPGFCNDSTGTPDTWKCGGGSPDGADCYYNFECQSLVCGAGKCGQPTNTTSACVDLRKPVAAP